MSGDRSAWRLALAVFVVALAARSAWGVARWWREGLPPPLAFPDEQQYWGMAQSASRGEGFRDELGFRCGRMPLYPGFLTVFAGFSNGVAAAQAVQWVIGAAGAAMLSIWVARWGKGIAGTAGVLAAIDPFLVFSSSLLLTETVFVTLLIGLWCVLWDASDRGGLKRWIAVGLLAGTCLLVRESSIGLVGVGVLWALFVRRLRADAVVGALVAMGVVAVMLLPWAIRNHQILGEWRWLTTRGGISLYDGVRPGADGTSNLGDVKASNAVAGMTETQWDGHFREQAWAALRADPSRVLKLAGMKLARMWNPFPNVESHRSGFAGMVSAGWALPVFALACIGVFVVLGDTSLGGGWLVLFLLLPAVYLSLLHSVFVGSVRYRLPAMPFLEVLAAIAICRAVGPWPRRTPRATAL